MMIIRFAHLYCILCTYTLLQIYRPETNEIHVCLILLLTIGVIMPPYIGEFIGGKLIGARVFLQKIIVGALSASFSRAFREHCCCCRCCLVSSKLVSCLNLKIRQWHLSVFINQFRCIQWIVVANKNIAVYYPNEVLAR